MTKFDTLDSILQKNKGFIRTAEVEANRISRAYFGQYIKERNLERAAQGLYMSQDAWDDGMYVIQVRYPSAVFSHETASYLLNLAEREPLQFAVTLKEGANTAGLTKHGIKVYKVKTEMFEEGVITVRTQTGQTVRAYNAERTVCDLVRSRRKLDAQEVQAAFKAYMVKKDKNIPLLLRYAKSFNVEKIIRGYLEVTLQ
ncbi:MAG: type IV toxin-antitoxin system AbiEi family antitoxin domain-containing protein [Oscillospiraceae bacterium]|nr:type IV toxin-antitoxin system AbiEi family antitoxin domain-containing protein [Oscillospiraceae bacterium]MCL2280111.1 type IV toxin-antitoxin system AbiEi family antitoxin domain-containing protein [Oscillospiraceae bacterium]